MENDELDLSGYVPVDKEEFDSSIPSEAQLEQPQQVIEPEVIQRGSFPAPFHSKIGGSTVDLSIPENETQMKTEYDEWWNFGKKRGFLGIPYVSKEFKGERDKLKDAWYRKYHGMTLEEYGENQKGKTIYGYDANLKGMADQIDNNFQALSLPGLAWADFGMDTIGSVGGKWGSWLDDRWDEATKMDNPQYQNTRRVLSIVLPSIYTGGKTNQFLAARGVNKYPFLAKHLTKLGAYGLESGTVALLSDTSEDHNAAKTVADLTPGLFGPKGWIPIPEAWKTKESDSPAARKMMNFYENTALSFVGTILGAFIDSKNAFKSRVDFIEPIDESATKYKQVEKLKDSEAEDLIELQRLNTLLSSDKLNKQTENQLINEILNIEDR